MLTFLFLKSSWGGKDWDMISCSQHSSQQNIIDKSDIMQNRKDPSSSPQPSLKLSKILQRVSVSSVQQGIQEIIGNVVADGTSKPSQVVRDMLIKAASSFNISEGVQELEDQLFRRRRLKKGLVNKYITSVVTIINKSGESIKQLVEGVLTQELSEDNEGEQNLSTDNGRNRIKTSPDNQFMGEEFGSMQRLEEVKEYCAALKNDAIDHYILQTEQKQQQVLEAAKKISGFLEKCLKQSLKTAFQVLTDPPKINENNKQSDSDRPSSANRQIIKGSAQSQRIKSASRRGSDAGSDEFNFDLTSKTKNSKNPFKSLIKQDSLMYSAQSDFGYHPSSPLKGPQKESPESKTQDKRLQLIEDTEEDHINQSNLAKSNQHEHLQVKLQNTVEDDFQIPSNLSHRKGTFDNEEKSVDEQIDNYDGFEADDEDQRQFESARYQKKDLQQAFRKRVGTEAAVAKNSIDLSKNSSNKRFQKIDLSKHSHLNSQVNIFATQISSYQTKIAKLKEAKEQKRQKLKQELARVNFEIKVLQEKEEEITPQNMNHYASRAQISDNVEARKKAESLVKNLRSQKRNRNIAKIGEFKNLDKNINEYMEELTKLRANNEEKIKQKKKLEILERMKQHEIRKMNDRKKIEANQQFVMHLKSPIKASESPIRSRVTQKQKQAEEEIHAATPQLSQKKAYLNKIRSFSVKKSKKDVYEQVLS